MADTDQSPDWLHEELQDTRENWEGMSDAQLLETTIKANRSKLKEMVAGLSTEKYIAHHEWLKSSLATVNSVSQKSILENHIAALETIKTLERAKSPKGIRRAVEAFKADQKANPTAPIVKQQRNQ